MILNPVVPPWILVIVGVVCAGVAVWQMVSHRSSVRLILLWASRLLMIVLLIIIALRPTILGEEQGPSVSGGLEVYFVVDTTSSMAAEDQDAAGAIPADPNIPRTRLMSVTADIESITEELFGAQFSLVTFDAATVQRVPLTSDTSALNSAASVLRQEVTAYSRGSSIDEPLSLLTELLTEAQALNPDQRRVLFYFGDGEQTSELPPRSFEQLVPYLDGGAVVGYGTQEGGRMREFVGLDPKGFGQNELDDGGDEPIPNYIQDYSGDTPVDAVSRIDKKNLEKIARQLDVDYLHPSASVPVSAATRDIEVGDISAQDGEPATVTELYWIFAIAFGALAGVQLISISGAVAELRQSRRKP
ncbi:MAG: VWA domain-containing protein [Rhodoglobus sp.]